MIDWDFEDRLIERVEARAAIAEALNPRQRRMLRCQLQGMTFQELATQEGISQPRARQISLKSVERLQRWVHGWRPPPPPPPKPPPEPKRYVDPAVARQRLLDKEQRHLRRMLEAEEAERRAVERRRQQAEETRRLHSLREARFFAQERADWIRALQEAIALCDGTHYAVLIPQMMNDIDKINAQPEGALPWRFDPVAFRRHFESFKAQIDAGTYRSV